MEFKLTQFISIHFFKPLFGIMMLTFTAHVTSFAQASSITIKVIKDYDRTDGGERHKTSYRIQEFKAVDNSNTLVCDSMEIKVYQRSSLPTDKSSECVYRSKTGCESTISLSSIDSLVAWFKSKSVEHTEKDRIIFMNENLIYVNINRNGEEINTSLFPNYLDHRNSWNLQYFKKIYNPKLDSVIFNVISGPELSGLRLSPLPISEAKYHVSELDSLTNKYINILRTKDTTAMLQMVDDLMPDKATAEYFRLRNFSYGALNEVIYNPDGTELEEHFRIMRSNMSKMFLKNFRYISKGDEVKLFEETAYKTQYFYADRYNNYYEVDLPKSDSALEFGEIYFDVLINEEKVWMKFGEMFRVDGKWKVIR